MRDSQEAVRQANSQLPPRHREVLALREVAGRSYDEIGEIMGISENAAAQLIFRARGKLKGALTAGAVASVVAATDECEVAQLLINRLQDGELITDDEQELARRPPRALRLLPGRARDAVRGGRVVPRLGRRCP